ncbi:MAG: DMT family transporter, partial [Pseudonocardiaceae bacterium]
WAIGASATIAVIVLLIAIGRTRQGHGRAALLGVAAGVTFGLTAAFMKGMTVSFHHGPLGVLSTWQTYAVVVAGVLGMFLMQNALHAGRLIAAQPGITLADPAVAIAWGVAVFNEKAQGGLFLIWAVLSATVMAGGAIFLARSPVLEDSTAGRDEGHATSPGRYLGERSPTTAATPPRK